MGGEKGDRLGLIEERGREDDPSRCKYMMGECVVLNEPLGGEVVVVVVAIRGISNGVPEGEEKLKI